MQQLNQRAKMRKSQLIRLSSSALILVLFCSYSEAQEVSNFSEKNLPNKSPQKNEVLPKVSVDDAPIKNLEVNKSTLLSDARESIDTLLLNNDKTVSLMFDDEENNNSERALDSFRNNQQFIPEESEEERSTNAKKKGEENQKAQENEIAENEKSFIYLASIIYFTAKDWAVWINDQKVTYESNNPEKELYLASVTNNSVKLMWKISLSKWKILSGQKVDAQPPSVNANNQVEIEFELHPNQTFSLKAGKVAEGRPISTLLKSKSSENSDSKEKLATP